MTIKLHNDIHRFKIIDISKAGDLLGVCAMRAPHYS